MTRATHLCYALYVRSRSLTTATAITNTLTQKTNQDILACQNADEFL